MNATTEMPNSIEVGIGVSSSAARGAKIVRPLEMKLQIPVAVALFKKGNTL